MKNQTIGIEIEMTGLTKAKAAEITASFLSGTVRRTYDTYDSYLVTAIDGRVWRIMGDIYGTKGKKAKAYSTKSFRRKSRRKTD